MLGETKIEREEVRRDTRTTSTWRAIRLRLLGAVVFNQSDRCGILCEGFTADELALVELVTAYEREFKISIPNADADKFHQVRDVVAYLKKRGALK